MDVNMRRIFKLRSQGLSCRRISRGLNVHIKTVRSIVVPSYARKLKAKRDNKS